MKTSALFTDLYELTMAQAYAAEHMDERAVFELTFRKMPENRNYIVAAGIADVLEFLANFRFSHEELDCGSEPSFRTASSGASKVCGLPEMSMQFQKEPLSLRTSRWCK